MINKHSILSPRMIDLIGFPGELFMNLLKALILPLIAASLVSGLSQLDARQSGRIGAFAVLYYTVTLVSDQSINQSIYHISADQR